MKCALIFVLALSLASSSNKGDFLNGLIKGLEANPASIGACGTEVTSLVDYIFTIAEDIVNVASEQKGALLKLSQDYQAFDAVYNNYKTDCNLGPLFRTLDQLFTPEGIRKAMKTYLVPENLIAIDNDVYNIYNCEKDFGVCGQSLGDIIRILTNFNLNSNLKIAPVMMNKPQLLSFIQGFGFAYANSISNSALCKGDMLRLIPNLGQFINDIINGNKIAKNIIDSSVEYTVLKTCWETDWKNFYTIEKITAFFKPLNDLKAWQLSYFMNTATMNSLFQQLRNCSSNLQNCGAVFPQFVNLVTPWVNYGN